MPNSSIQTRHLTRSSGVAAQQVAVVIAAAVGVLTLGLLAAGSIAHHAGLLTWAMVCGMVALDLIVVLAVKLMIDDAVARCVAAVAEDTEAHIENTAERVAAAIAVALRDDRASDRDDGTVRLYS